MRYGEISSFQSGVAVPVFSLHSQDSVGIGEFLDLVPFGAWAKKCGLSIIQILPVNDTGFESSPYSARSAFAFFVAKANEVTDAGEARVVAECGDSRKRIPH